MRETFRKGDILYFATDEAVLDIIGRLGCYSWADSRDDVFVPVILKILLCLVAYGAGFDGKDFTRASSGSK